MKTVHLIYPHGNRISCPDAIGRNLGKHLASHGYNVSLYDWSDGRTILPGADDVLVGHPHPVPSTIFRRSLKQPGWKRKIALFPFTPGDPVQNAFGDSFICDCDQFLAITGNYWIGQVSKTMFSHWEPKVEHLDLAIDRLDFPILRRGFNPVGKRKFVYIGHSGWPKNTKYLSSIAKEVSSTEFAWIGRPAGNESIEGVLPLGWQDFSAVEARNLVSHFDFLITVGSADANPTTILEAMAWGLIPVATKESGYFGFSSIPNVPLDRVEDAAAIVHQLQNLPDEELVAMQRRNWQLLDSHFNWTRFGNQVIDAIESASNSPCGPESKGRRMRLKFDAMRSPYSQFGFKRVKMLARRKLNR